MAITFPNWQKPHPSSHFIICKKRRFYKTSTYYTVIGKMNEMNEKKDNSHIFKAKLNLGFVLRVTPEDMQKIKEFIESLENVTIVHSQVSGNRLFIKEEG